MNKAKIFMILEFAAILFLLYLYIPYLKHEQPKAAQLSGKITGNSLADGFLSSRVYYGILKPDNLLLLNTNPLKDGIKNYLSEEKINASVYILSLVDSTSFGINENVQFEPASLNKLPFAMLIMKEVENGEINLDEYLDINSQDKDSSSGILYKQNTSKLKVRDLLNLMLTDSDNTAYNVLKRQINNSEIVRLSNYLGFYETTPDNLVDPHSVNVKSISNFFTSLYLSTYLNVSSSEYLLSTLSNSTFDIKSYANLPENAAVAQKYGNYYLNGSQIFDDCGIIYYKDKRFFYCVMVQNSSGERSIEVISTIVRSITDYIDLSDKRTS